MSLKNEANKGTVTLPMLNKQETRSVFSLVLRSHFCTLIQQ